jgi:hypothetical protein
LIYCYIDTNTNLTQYKLTNTTTKLVVIREVATWLFFIIGGVPVVEATSSDQQLLFRAGQDVHVLLRIDLLRLWWRVIIGWWWWWGGVSVVVAFVITMVITIVVVVDRLLLLWQRLLHILFNAIGWILALLVILGSHHCHLLFSVYDIWLSDPEAVYMEVTGAMVQWSRGIDVHSREAWCLIFETVQIS